MADPVAESESFVVGFSSSEGGVSLTLKPETIVSFIYPIISAVKCLQK